MVLCATVTLDIDHMHRERVVWMKMNVTLSHVVEAPALTLWVPTDATVTVDTNLWCIMGNADVLI